MGDPITFEDFAYQTLALIIIGLLGEAAYRFYRPELHLYIAAEPRRTAGVAIASTLISMGIIWLVIFSLSETGVSEEAVYGPADVASITLLVFIMLAPVLIAMFVNREPINSAGITTTNLAFTLAISVPVAGVAVIERGLMTDWHLTFGIAQFWSLIYFIIVAFGEEFLFRGYLQSRLEAWLGNFTGLFIASLAMALSHIAQRMSMMQMTFDEAFLNSAALISVSLFFGFIYMRTRNLIAPVILHTIANWLFTL